MIVIVTLVVYHLENSGIEILVGNFLSVGMVRVVYHLPKISGL